MHIRIFDSRSPHLFHAHHLTSLRVALRRGFGWAGGMDVVLPFGLKRSTGAKPDFLVASENLGFGGSGLAICTFRCTTGDEFPWAVV